jgi:hypothetical protein
VPFIVNLFGESLRIWICHLPHLVYLDFHRHKEKYKLHWIEIFTDLHFMQKQGFANFTDFVQEEEINVFMLNKHNSIEVKQKNKIILKIKSDELTDKYSLFPLFKLKNTYKTIPLSEYTFLITQKEIGLFGKFLIETESFQLESLTFEILQASQIYNEPSFLSCIYANEIVKRVSDDTLIRGITCVELYRNQEV